MLREKNKKYGAIKFVDICADDYSAEDNNGIDFETVKLQCSVYVPQSDAYPG